MKSVVIVPSNREEQIARFLEVWREEMASATILIVEDNPGKTFDVRGDNVIHYAWDDIHSVLGSKSWIVPSGSGCVGSFGVYMAHRLRPDMIVQLGDDCYPDPAYPGFLERHWSRLQEATDDAWVSSVDSPGVGMRGEPYFTRSRRPRVVLNHGLWSRVPDYDAPTQLLTARMPMPIAWKNFTVPRGRYFPMCSMNIAWRAELSPAMYFLLMGPSHAFDRFGDIWSGVLVKRVADHLGLAINSGEPAIDHQRASNVWRNLRKEAPGLEVNETFWRAVDSVVLTEESIGAAYAELARKLPLEGDYFTKLRQAMQEWTELFVS
jgi:hypothetical protein